MLSENVLQQPLNENASITIINEITRKQIQITQKMHRKQCRYFIKSCLKQTFHLFQVFYKIWLSLSFSQSFEQGAR